MRDREELPAPSVALIQGTRTDLRFSAESIKQTIALTRPDLHEAMGRDDAKLDWWLLLNGAREYKALEELAIPVPQDVLQTASADALPSVKPVLTKWMRIVWSMRPDLQAAFDLASVEGQQGFVWWYFIHGVSELALGRFLTPQQKRQLNQSDARIAFDSLMPISRLMFEIWQRRPDLQHVFDLGKAPGRQAFAAWYYTKGIVELGLMETIDAAQRALLLSPAPAPLRVSRVLALVWEADAGVRQRFPDLHDGAYSQWACGSEAAETFPLLASLTQNAAPANPAIQRNAKLEHGVNLVGYAKGQFGIGEDVRMAAQALQAAGVPFSIYNVEPGREVCQGDDSALHHVSNRLPYDVNVFCTTGIETARLAAVHGSTLFDGRRSIGYWPWELPEWPAQWHHAYELVDEVWASSRFTYDAFVRSSPKKVRHMPMAVTVDETAGLGRRHFRLPEDRFLFVFAFDFLSSLARKNPMACVTAFRSAFPRGDEPVGLVVKAMRVAPDNPLWQWLVEEVRSDGRIFIHVETMPRAKVLDLYRCCDCFVSLHRSEGFGRGIAEAMMLGKPVIVTGYSGNMDYTIPATAALVDYRLVPVQQGEYPFGEGMLWADPDIEHAGWWMTSLYESQSLYDSIAFRGNALIKEKYSLSTIGNSYFATVSSLSIPS